MVYIRGKIYIWVFLFFLLLAIDWMGGWWEGRGGVVLFRGHSPRRFHEEVNRRAAIIGLFLPLHGACKQSFFRAVSFLPRIYEREYNIYRS